MVRPGKARVNDGRQMERRFRECRAARFPLIPKGEASGTSLFVGAQNVRCMPFIYCRIVETKHSRSGNRTFQMPGLCMETRDYFKDGVCLWLN